jgi:sugar lactone lactonase YvrE
VVVVLCPLYVYPSTIYYISTIMGTGTASATAAGAAGTSTGINSPSGVAVGSDGSVYVSDTNNHIIRRMSANIVSTFAGTISTLGSTGDNGAATSGRLNFPAGICMNTVNNNLFIADRANNRIRRVSGGIIVTVCGTGRLIAIV